MKSVKVFLITLAYVNASRDRVNFIQAIRSFACENIPMAYDIINCYDDPFHIRNDTLANVKKIFMNKAKKSFCKSYVGLNQDRCFKSNNNATQDDNATKDDNTTKGVVLY